MVTMKMIPETLRTITRKVKNLAKEATTKKGIWQLRTIMNVEKQLMGRSLEVTNVPNRMDHPKVGSTRMDPATTVETALSYSIVKEGVDFNVHSMVLVPVEAKIIPRIIASDAADYANKCMTLANAKLSMSSRSSSGRMWIRRISVRNSRNLSSVGI
ncbi:LOW QUALITY PROTEIN: hypothetical protein PHMEG_00020871 [Phytophthora megakarya]|uniref:Uncharacterized protein n=1 Tax=Phytophthora megakarya TaxID=4795 RepID=A0A225VMT4_9STRA|nr:LOW QUALITY PROTEIN: hypothetical protein PHMEG_00020871 [Phytophthora megakarya]